MNTYRVILASLVGAVVLVLLGGGASFWAFEEIDQTAMHRKTSNIIITAANQLLSSLRDAETAQRGFSMTGDESFLTPYLVVKESLVGQLAKLRRISENGVSRKHLDAALPLLQAKVAEMDHVIHLRRTNDLAAVLGAVSGGEGKRLMDLISSELLAFVQIEENTRLAQESEFQTNMRQLFSAIVVASLFSLWLGVSFGYLMYRDRQHRLQEFQHFETKHLLEGQREANLRLEQANVILDISNEKLAVTLNSIGDAVIATDNQACVTLLNPHAEKLTGWKQAEAVGRPVDEVFRIIDQETRKSVVIPVHQTLSGGEGMGMMSQPLLISRDGGECAIADSCAPIFDREGRVVGAVLVFRDVTQEQASHQALGDSEEKYRLVFESSRDALMVLMPPTWCFTDVNQEALRLFGAKSKEDFTAFWPDGVSPVLQPDGKNSQERGKEMMEIALREGSTFFEWEHQRLNGERFSADVLLTSMEAKGQVWVQATVRDISLRKVAEEALVKAGALQNAIFNSANFSSIATDEKGVIQIFNVGAERMLGYAAADVMNKITPADISDPQEVVARAKALSSELGTPINPGFEALVFKASRGIEDIYELTYIRKDGSRFPAVVSITALRDAQSGIIGYLLIGTDNTARKRVEEEQKQLSQRLRDHQFYTRSLFEANTDALMTTDPEGIITDVNKQMEALTGCTRDELIGAPFKSYFTDPKRAEMSIKQVLGEKKVSDYELTAFSRDGKETVVSINATTFYDRDRRLQGVFAAARDVTERKRLDQILQENNAELQSARAVAEKANLAKSEFLSSMSHELRSPLNAILGFGQLMESETPPPTPIQKERIAQILRGGWHLLKLIDEILDLAKVESGQVPLSREPVSLVEIMLECQSMVEPQARQYGATMTFPMVGGALFVSGDRTRIKQVIINLLSNAIKYNRRGGAVDIQCAESTPGRIRMSIRDEGMGLSPDQIGQLFQAFNRLGQEIQGVEGTGIGLVVAKRLVELMGGVIGAESVVGSGSVFWFELLAAEQPSRNDHDGEAVSSIHEYVSAGSLPHTLLYVEDNSANLKLVEQIIERRRDLHLISATTGKSGIELARKMKPQVILMDINLPDMNGFEVLRILRLDPITAHIPVLALSANAMPRDIKNGLDKGFLQYLTKPIKIHEFLEAVDGVLERLEPIDENTRQEGLVT